MKKPKFQKALESGAKIVKEEKVKGERAIVLEAVPHSDQELEHLFGKVWGKKERFQYSKNRMEPKIYEKF